MSPETAIPGTDVSAPAPRPERFTADRDFWHGAELDLDAYLARVGLSGDPPPTPDTLRAVHRAHLAAIPFENLQTVLERPVPLDVPSLVDKTVRRRGGGYGYEQNLLLAAALDQEERAVVGKRLRESARM